MNDFLGRKRRIDTLLFATSNPSKFLQARLVLGRYGYEVERLEAHRRPYVEPYGLPTSEFLQAGMQEVTSRAGSNGLLFIEDTTVCFPALSGNGAPFPGQATKEWFAATTHTDLIEALDRASVGDRRAVVRSDIALRIPGLDAPVIFSGWTEGAVVDHVPPLSPNELYPWLGAHDFSSWFIPQGASRVLSAMSIEESLRHDFRAKALELLAARLKEYESAAAFVQSGKGRVTTSSSKVDQLLLFPSADSQMVLVVVGPPAAGKTTIGHYLSMYRDFTHIEGSRELAYAASLCDLHGSSSYELARLLFAAQGFDAVERLSVIPIISELQGPIVYTGCRTLEGLSALMEACAENDRTLRILQVTAPLSVRLARANDRARSMQHASDVSFSEADARDQAFGLLSYAGLLADLVLRNDRGLQRLLEKLDEALPALESGHRRENPRRDAIVCALASAKSAEEVARILEPLAHSRSSAPLSPLQVAREMALIRILRRKSFT